MHEINENSLTNILAPGGCLLFFSSSPSTMLPILFVTSKVTYKPSAIPYNTACKHVTGLMPCYFSITFKKRYPFGTTPSTKTMNLGYIP